MSVGRADGTLQSLEVNQTKAEGKKEENHQWNWTEEVRKCTRDSGLKNQQKALMWTQTHTKAEASHGGEPCMSAQGGKSERGMKKQRPCRWAEVTSRVRVGRWVSTWSSRLSFSQCGFLTNVRNIKTKVGTGDSKSRCQRLVPILHPFPPDFTKEQEWNRDSCQKENH